MSRIRKVRVSAAMVLLWLLTFQVNTSGARYLDRLASSANRMVVDLVERILL